MNQVEQEKWMEAAIGEAKRAAAIGEVPIGAVIVKGDSIVGRGFNQRETLQEATAHAEILAIEDANRQLGGWRLTDCTLFVTLEPCPMCAGAILQARIDQVVYGAPDPKAGSVDTLYRLLSDPRFNHRAQVISGVHQDICGEMLRQFFRVLRMRDRT